MKVLLVIDVQNDFVDGALGTAEAQAMLPCLLKKVEEFDGKVIMTKDTHGAEYLTTQEGQKLPVPHCIKGTDGWELAPSLAEIAVAKQAEIYEKPTFGSVDLAKALQEMNESEPIESIELIGLCTDICVVSNAMLIKAALPEIPVMVDAACCAGVTKELHEAALTVMESCQITVSRQ